MYLSLTGAPESVSKISKQFKIRDLSESNCGPTVHPQEAR